MIILKSIKGRLFLWFFTFASFLLIILGLLLYYKVKDVVFTSMDQTLHSKVQIIAGLLHEEQGTTELELSEIVSGEYSIPRSGHYYKLILGGKLLATSPSLVDNHFDLTSGTLEFFNEKLKERVYTSIGPDNEPIRVIQHDFKFLGKSVIVFAAQSLRDSINMINRFRHFLLIVIPPTIVIGGIVGLWITKKSLNPLETFSRKVSQITYKDIDKRIDAKAHAQELHNLAGSFNDMLDRLQKAFQAEYENERKKVALKTLKRLMVTLSHYLLNANMIIGGKVRHSRKVESNKDNIASLKVIEEQARKIDAVIGALKKVTEIKTSDYTNKGQALMINITQEIEEQLSQIKA